MSVTKPSRSLQLLQSLLRETLRISIDDGRIFIGTFVGTDKSMNVLLVNTDEFRLGPNENPNGRFVGQVLIPWKKVRKAEMEATYGAEELDVDARGDETETEGFYM